MLGTAERIRQEGMAEGFEQGLSQGLVQGLSQIVNYMLSLGKTTSDIEQLTGVSRDVIEKISSEFDKPCT